MTEINVRDERKRPLPVRQRPLPAWQTQQPTTRQTEHGDAQAEAGPAWVLQHETVQPQWKQSSDGCARRAEEQPEDEELSPWPWL
jgi:hypothetical protein